MSLRRILSSCLMVASVATLGGCDLLGIESPQTLAARREAEGKALGAACRHAGRAIEDCYTLNPKAEKAAIFAGWREMNDYMIENKIEVVPPQLARPSRPGRKSETASEPEAEASQSAGDKAKGSKE